MASDTGTIKPKPAGLNKPYAGKIIKAMSKVNVAAYRWTGGLLGSTWRVGAARLEARRLTSATDYGHGWSITMPTLPATPPGPIG